MLEGNIFYRRTSESNTHTHTLARTLAHACIHTLTHTTFSSVADKVS